MLDALVVSVYYSIPSTTPTATPTSTPSPTATPTRTFTPVPPTATRTFTPVPPTATWTPVPTATFTPVPPTPTPDRCNPVRNQVLSRAAYMKNTDWPNYRDWSFYAYVSPPEGPPGFVGWKNAYFNDSASFINYVAVNRQKYGGPTLDYLGNTVHTAVINANAWSHYGANRPEFRGWVNALGNDTNNLYNWIVSTPCDGRGNWG
jgi:hypothetical protein